MHRRTISRAVTPTNAMEPTTATVESTVLVVRTVPRRGTVSARRTPSGAAPIAARSDSAAVDFDRSVDVRVTRLRRTIEVDPGHPQFVRTVRGEGYLFNPRGPDT